MNWNINSKQLIKLLTQHGWYLQRVRGDHWQFKHNKLPGKVTIPHPKKQLARKTIKSILQQAQISLNE